MSETNKMTDVQQLRTALKVEELKNRFVGQQLDFQKK